MSNLEDSMKTGFRLALVLAGAFFASAFSQAAGNGENAIALAELLSGTFVSATPNNSLQLDITTITADPLHQWDMFLSVRGKFENTNVRQQGLIRLETQGRSVYFGYVPHFDATITAMSPNASRFTEQESNAACGFSLTARGDGFAGETLGSQCAIAMRGATHKWKIEVESGTILLQDPVSGETLRFRRLEKSGKTN